MKSLSGVNRLSKERCECNNCDRELSVDEVKHTWKCPSCGEARKRDLPNERRRKAGQSERSHREGPGSGQDP